MRILLIELNLDKNRLDITEDVLFMVMMMMMMMMMVMMIN